MNRVTDDRGCRIAYRVEGTGPAVLFIQGVGVQGAGLKELAGVPALAPEVTRGSQ